MGGLPHVHCDVVIVGYRLNAKEPAPKALERILGLFAEDARKLARSFPATVLAAGSEEQAERLMEQLTAAGALVELRASKPMPAPAPREASTATRSLRSPRLSLATGAKQGARMSLATGDRSALELAHSIKPRAPQQGDAHKPAPPPPPAAALYQLGDFGLAAPSVRPGAPLVVPAPPPAGLKQPGTGAARRASMAGGGLELDFDLSSMPLELDQPDSEVQQRRSAHTASVPEDPHSLGERFSDDSPGRAPAVEERAARSPQRVARSVDSRRPGAVRTRTEQGSGARVVSGLRGWAPSALTLLAIGVVSIFSVGYALDPEDALGALVREHASALVPADPGSEDPADANLHPLLRATPHAARNALAAILRSHIDGVHEVPISAQGASPSLRCAVVENAEGETATRLAQLRETGHEVAVPESVSAQLRQREQALRSEAQRPELAFTEVCLTL